MKIKLSIYVLFLLLGTSVAYSQTDGTTSQTLVEVTNQRTFYKVVDSMPRFPGCEDETDNLKRKKCAEKTASQFLSGKVRYPQLARKNGTQGKAFVSFVVEADGTLTNFRIDHDPGDGCGAEALRVLQSMPDWIPGSRNGQAVAVEMRYPVTFSLGK